jgi:hypothetical protein
MIRYFTFSFFLFLAAIFVLTSCNKDKDSNPAETEDRMHWSFKLDTWNKNVDCHELTFCQTKDERPAKYDSTISYFNHSFSSASTSATLFFSFPVDSAALVAMTSKKYAIQTYSFTADSSNIGGFAMSIPREEKFVSNSYGNKLYTEARLNTDISKYFHKVEKVSYIKSDLNWAYFQVKGSYNMNMYIPNDTTYVRPLSGEYLFRFKAMRK